MELPLWDISTIQIDHILARFIRNLKLSQRFQFVRGELSNYLALATFIGIMNSLNQTVFDVVDVPESPSVHDIQKRSNLEVFAQKLQLFLLQPPLNRFYFFTLQIFQLIQYLAQPIVFAFQNIPSFIF